MKILNAKQIQACDAYTIKHEPIESIDLMERASLKLCEWIIANYKKTDAFKIFAGVGNNGGDALALARLLFEKGYKNITVVWLKFSENISDDCQTNFERLRLLDGISKHLCTTPTEITPIKEEDIVVDGIFGSGLTREVSGNWATVINHINDRATEIISIDVPSGLFCEDNTENTGAIIKANFTLSFQFPKLAFFLPENEDYVGVFSILDIGLHADIIDSTETKYQLLNKDNLLLSLKSRKKFAHKGHFGHAFLIAGSYQKTGAAILAAKSCMRSGVGLLTVHVPQSAYSIMQTAVPEAMLCIDETELNFCSTESLSAYNAIGIGPGLGKKQSVQNALFQTLKNSNTPLVIDADGLNILAENKIWIESLPKNSILTPHPKEFDRLSKKHTNSFERLNSQIHFSKQYGIIVILKGAFTSISTPKGQVFFNSTGNPGMATAGSGDVLTGIILSLLAQNYAPLKAALLGVHLHGMAGDFASRILGYEALIASDIIDRLPDAFKALK